MVRLPCALLQAQRPTRSLLTLSKQTRCELELRQRLWCLPRSLTGQRPVCRQRASLCCLRCVLGLMRSFLARTLKNGATAGS